MHVGLPIGDPAGIGPEIVLKFLLGANGADRFTVYGDVAPLRRQAALCGLPVQVGENSLELPDGRRIPLVSPGLIDEIAVRIGEVDAASGAACVAYAKAAIADARAGRIDAVIAAPHTEAAVHAAGIAFSGYPGLLAQACGLAEDDVFLLLVIPEMVIGNVTLHVPLADVPALLTEDRILKALRAMHLALHRKGQGPAIGVCGLNPHAGEGGLFGREDMTIIAPAIARARAEQIDAHGPFAADAVLADRKFPAYLAMYHDQAHIPFKLLAPRRGSALSIGAPVLFGSVAHGSAHDIAGRGVATADALANAIGNLKTIRP